MEIFIRRLFIIFSILLLLIIHCNCKYMTVEIMVYVSNGEIIDDIFKPQKMLGEGSFANVWKGYLDQNKVDALDLIKKNEGRFRRKTHSENNTTQYWRPIAMKILEQTDMFERERNLFTRLLAYKNKTVEKYGIPAMWYEGAFLKKYHAIGMTLCDASISDKYLEIDEILDPLDLLAIFYQTLKCLKYIHGKEIIHQDLKANNLMVKGAQLFLIDFNAADWIYDRDYDSGGNYRYRSIAYYANGVKGFYMDDLKSLYYVMIDLCGVLLPWNELDSEEDEAERLELKLQYDVVRNLCLEIEPKYLGWLLIDFHDQIMINVTSIEDVQDDKRIFDYDTMGNKILNLIGKLTGLHVPLFTWLSDEEKEDGVWNFLPIDSVPGPTTIVDGKEPIKKTSETKCSVQ